MTTKKKKKKKKHLPAHIVYSSNNSGGSWWLEDSDWKRLEKAGWIVHWYHDVNADAHKHRDKHHSPDFGEHNHHYTDDVLTPSKPANERWLGALATSAAKITNDPSEAIEEFERVANQNVDDEGCGCCGSPHSFTYYDENGESHYFHSRPSGYTRDWS